MTEILNSTVGTICYSVVLFGLGALVGKPMFIWLNSKAPWSKS